MTSFHCAVAYGARKIVLISDADAQPVLEADALGENLGLFTYYVSRERGWVSQAKR